MERIERINRVTEMAEKLTRFAKRNGIKMVVVTDCDDEMDAQTNSDAHFLGEACDFLAGASEDFAAFEMARLTPHERVYFCQFVKGENDHNIFDQ